MAKEAPNTMVFDGEGFGLEYVEEPKGRSWRYGQLWVYLALREGETLKPFELPNKLNDLPEKLYRALFWDRETEVLFTMRNSLMEKLSLVGTYILIGVLLFFMFLIYSSV